MTDTALSGQNCEGGVTPPGQNGPPMGSLLVGEALRDLNDLGPVRPGHCDFCGKRLPRGKARYCSDFCRKHMDREIRNLGRTLTQIALHWVEGKANKGPALRRMDQAMRHFRNRLIETRKKYGWGEE